ncbi:conjugal transfer protein TraI [Parafilimonas sp.]|uniref:conjugal transfer protein TraI n=1 Tax=Parafilimonas sp. TaxID=1969739 RepID=UPI003F7FFCC7
MKKLIVLLAICSVFTVRTNAQFGIGQIIKLTVTKVIKAIDLQVQRIQNKTVVLQNAQKVVENTMSELHLNEITGWVQKQKDLYSSFYKDLWKVKTIITDYHRVKEIAERQAQLVSEYQHAWNMLRQDKHFTADEINYMAQVYSGILNQTVQNINQLFTVVNSFTTQMSDAERMEIINNVNDEVNKNYNDLHQFNTQNSLLTLSRTKDENDAAMVKWMYSLP